MDHTAVVREKMTERYLLNELDSPIRDEFEEHYFDCPDCALDVSAGAQFIEQSKMVLTQKNEPIPIRPTPSPRPSPGWFAWLRPAFAAPALALLLAIAGYQNLVTYPRLQSELKRPQVLPAVSVNLGTYSIGGTPTSVPDGKGLLLFVRIPPDGAYTRYTAELYNPGGKLEGSFTVAAAAGQDQWPVTIPGAPREAGTYTIAIHGVTPAGETKDLGSTSFQLRIQR
jgi:hypothetical protein